MVYYNTILSGGLYEACLWPDAFLFRNRYDPAFIYPGNPGNTGVHHLLSDSGISFVLLLKQERPEPFYEMKEGCRAGDIARRDSL